MVGVRFALIDSCTTYYHNIMFIDGTTDTLASSLLSSISFTFQHGQLRGWTTDSPAWKQLLQGTDGEYVVHSQITKYQTTFDWYRHDGKIYFVVTKVTR